MPQPALVLVVAILNLARTDGTEPRRTRVIRSWPDEVMVDGRSTPGRVEVVFDYGAGRASEIRYDAAGRQVATLVLAEGSQPAPSAEEIQEAEDAVRQDPELSRILRRTRGRLLGGFLLQRKDGPCGPGSRCLQIQMVTADRMGTVRWSVYDLVGQTFAYRDYTPASEPAAP